MSWSTVEGNAELEEFHGISFSKLFSTQGSGQDFGVRAWDKILMAA